MHVQYALMFACLCRRRIVARSRSARIREAAARRGAILAFSLPMTPTCCTVAGARHGSWTAASRRSQNDARRFADGLWQLRISAPSPSMQSENGCSTRVSRRNARDARKSRTASHNSTDPVRPALSTVSSSRSFRIALTPVTYPAGSEKELNLFRDIQNALSKDRWTLCAFC